MVAFKYKEQFITIIRVEIHPHLFQDLTGGTFGPVKELIEKFEYHIFNLVPARWKKPNLPCLTSNEIKAGVCILPTSFSEEGKKLIFKYSLGKVEQGSTVIYLEEIYTAESTTCCE